MTFYQVFSASAALAAASAFLAVMECFFHTSHIWLGLMGCLLLRKGERRHE